MRGRLIAGIGLWAIAGTGLISLAFFQPLIAVIPGAMWTVMTIYGLASVGYKAMFLPLDRIASIGGKLLGFGLFAPLVSRFYPEHLENENRKEILGYIESNPGASIQEVREATGVAWGTAVYHLDRLRKSEKVVSHRHGNHHRFWVSHAPEARVRRGWSVLEQPTARDIAMAVATRPGSHQGAICEALNVRAPSASKHLSRLEQHGLVEKQRISRYTVYQPTEQLEKILQLRGDIDGGLEAEPPESAPPAQTAA